MSKYKKHIFIETIETRGIRVPFTNKYLFQKTSKHLADFRIKENDWYVTVPVRQNLTIVIATDKDEK
jgi:hypothetical protein